MLTNKVLSSGCAIFLFRGEHIYTQVLVQTKWLFGTREAIKVMWKLLPSIMYNHIPTLAFASQAVLMKDTYFKHLRI